MMSNSIKESRKRAKMSLVELGKHVGISGQGLAQVEAGKVQRLDMKLLVRIADTLNDLSILTNHCQSCPIRDAVILKQFPDLNNIRRDPAVITARLRKEMMEGAAALDVLTERFSDKDFQERDDYQEIFQREMEQVVDVKRGIEILEFELIMASVHSSGDLKRVYDNQQAKCEACGHHKPEVHDGSQTCA